MHAAGQLILPVPSKLEASSASSRHEISEVASDPRFFSSQEVTKHCALYWESLLWLSDSLLPFLTVPSSRKMPNACGTPQNKLVIVKLLWEVLGGECHRTILFSQFSSVGVCGHSAYNVWGTSFHEQCCEPELQEQHITFNQCWSQVQLFYYRYSGLLNGIWAAKLAFLNDPNSHPGVLEKWALVGAVWVVWVVLYVKKYKFARMSSKWKRGLHLEPTRIKRFYTF